MYLWWGGRGNERSEKDPATLAIIIPIPHTMTSSNKAPSLAIIQLRVCYRYVCVSFPVYVYLPSIGAEKNMRESAVARKRVFFFFLLPVDVAVIAQAPTDETVRSMYVPPVLVLNRIPCWTLDLGERPSWSGPASLSTIMSALIKRLASQSKPSKLENDNNYVRYFFYIYAERRKEADHR